MKRVILALLGLLCAAGLCMAQSWQARHQIGTATQEMKTEGMSAAHSRIPIGSKAKITNPANGLEIEVTITGQIPESSQRIIDLSPSAARALDLGSGGPVMVVSLSSQVPQDPAAQSSEVDVQMGKQPFNITINNYIINPDKLAPPENNQENPVQKEQTGYNARTEPEISRYPPESPNMAAESPVSPVAALPAALPAAQPPTQPAAQPLTQPEVSSSAQAAAQPADQAQPAVQPPAQPAKPPLFTAPPVYDPQIIPGLPNPNTNKVYRLMVGTYPGVDSAFPVCRQLQAAGFDVDQEQAGDMCRVFAKGIPASRVYYAAKRLGAIGFSQIWIQE